MVTANLSFSLKPIDDGLVFLERIAFATIEAGRATANEITPQFLDELRYYPPKAKQPIEWTSERQRRFVMAKLRAEDNIPYQRTGGLADGWDVELIEDEASGEFAYRASNAWPGAVYVVGALSASPGIARIPQQRFHRNTGWPLAGETVAFWQDEFQVRFRANLDEAYDDLAQTVFSRSSI